MTDLADHPRLPARLLVLIDELIAGVLADCVPAYQALPDRESSLLERTVPSAHVDVTGAARMTAPTERNEDAVA